MLPRSHKIDRLVFETGLVRIGAFRCYPEHPAFHDTGPIKNYCFVFPRTAVEIQHGHEPAFVANPNVVTFYNSGQVYARNAISLEGDHCDWFGVEAELVRDAMRGFDARVEDRPERPFLRSRGWSDASTYLFQRRLFTRVTTGKAADPLAVEEAVIDLLDRVIRCTYARCLPFREPEIRSGQWATAHDIEAILSRRLERRLSLRSIAREVGLSAYHVCRLFRRVTGTTLHQYRVRLRLREALTEVVESRRPLTDIALDAGFSSHSHFTDFFHREFGVPPSWLRATCAAKVPVSNFVIAQSSQV